MATRGRPPKPGGAQTAAQRKAAQRQRDRINAWSDAPLLAEATVQALQAAAGHCIKKGYTDRLALVLRELGRRGGLAVSIMEA